MKREQPPPKLPKPSKQYKAQRLEDIDSNRFDAIVQEVAEFVAFMTAPLNDGWPEGWKR